MSTIRSFPTNHRARLNSLPNMFLRPRLDLVLKSHRLFTFSRPLTIHSFDNTQITVSFDGPDKVSFNTVFLRDACNSEESVDVSTRQKSFTTAHIAEDLAVLGEPTVEEPSELGEKALSVTWKHHDGKVSSSLFPESFLKKSSTPRSRFEGKFFPEKRVYWTRKDLVKDMKSLNFDYHAFLKGENTFKQALNSLNRFGLFFVNNIVNPLQNPNTQTLSEANAALWPVAKLGEKFGYIKKTFYGTLFDVKNDKNAKNIANTNVFLPLHMDLCYYESPPGLQLLHFIHNSTTGGENVFADSFLAAYHIRDTDPEAYEALKTVPLTFHYDNNGEYYYYMRPLIVEDPYIQNFETGLPQLKEVNYSPPFQGPLELSVTRDENPQLFDAFLRGMITFEKFVNDSKNQYVVKTPENSCVIFDNRRILHSRLQFSDTNGGDRWLMGCYVDGDSFRSKLRVLNRK